MAETLTVFTVRGEPASEARAVVRWSDEAESVVGIVLPDGRELWLPQDPEAYKFIAGYREGYDPQSVESRSLYLGDMTDRFSQFFQEFLLGREWGIGIDYQSGEEIKYNCDGVAFWLTGRQDDWDLKGAKRLAENVITQGERVQGVSADMGKVAVVGAASGIKDKPIAVHSYVVIGDGLAIQATGAHGRIVIASQLETQTHYGDPWYVEMNGVDPRTYGTYSL
jgi:hypothetical protein